MKLLNNRQIVDENLYQSQNENKVTEIELEVPEAYQDFNKKIVFETPDEKLWDLFVDNKYTIKSAITKYESVKYYIWLTKDIKDDAGNVIDTQDFRSKRYEMVFNLNTDANDQVTEEEVNGVKTVITLLENEITKVKNLQEEIEALETNIQNAETSRATAEAGRVSAESSRVSEENSRKIAETSREEYISQVKKEVEEGDFDGATFTPSVDSEGNISWTNDKGKENPPTQNIKGQKGDKGETGDFNFATFEINIDTGNLIANKTENLELIKFDINSKGEMEVVI